MTEITCPWCGKQTEPKGKGRHRFGTCKCGAGYSVFEHGHGMNTVHWTKEESHG